MDQYVTHDLPVIVKDAAVDWPITTLDGIIQVMIQHYIGFVQV